MSARRDRLVVILAPFYCSGLTSRQAVFCAMYWAGLGCAVMCCYIMPGIVLYCAVLCCPFLVYSLKVVSRRRHLTVARSSAGCRFLSTTEAGAGAGTAGPSARPHEQQQPQNPLQPSGRAGYGHLAVCTVSGSCFLSCPGLACPCLSWLNACCCCPAM